MCINLDRQCLAFTTPGEIRAMVRECVKRLNAPEGGLMVSGSVWDDVTPLEDIAALCDALEEYCLRR